MCDWDRQASRKLVEKENFFYKYSTQIKIGTKHSLQTVFLSLEEECVSNASVDAQHSVKLILSLPTVLKWC